MGFRNLGADDGALNHGRQGARFVALSISVKGVGRVIINVAAEIVRAGQIGVFDEALKHCVIAFNGGAHKRGVAKFG